MLAPTLTLADFQNAVPLLKELSVVNESSSAWGSLELRVESVPAFFQPRVWRMDALQAGERLSVADTDMALDNALLARLTEAEKAVITFSLVQVPAAKESPPVGAGEPDPSTDSTEPIEPVTPVVLSRLDAAVELLPRNQWSGLAQLPEMIAAFVQPNEPVVERLVRQAADILHDNGCDPAINGYQGGAQHAWEQASALWVAVAGLSLAYALPPASFEQGGQKIRSPQQVVDSGLATCLDSTLLLCSALEQAGLNPLIVFTQGHAFAGVWLRAEEFPSSVIDDITSLRKRVSLRELVLFETTLVTHRPAPSFQVAVEQGARHVAESVSDQFTLAVDVRRARLQRIKPMSSLSTLPVGTTAASETTPALSSTGFSAAPQGLDTDRPPAEKSDVPQTPEDRLTRWRRNLLDLSLRNNLLNFRSGAKAVKLEAPEPAALEDLLSDGRAVRLLARPELMEGRDPRAQAVHESRTLEDLRRDHARDALKRREVFIDLKAPDMEARLLELFRSSRATLQESGANTLFLAVGFLCWTKDRDDTPDARYRAPLLLLPVTLQRQSVRSGFSLTLLDDEPRFNPTLIEMLKQDFDLRLDISDQELPRDGAGLDIAALWKTVSLAVKDIRGWEVSEEVVLSSFSFAKYLMWKDLADRVDQLRNSPVVRHLLDTPRDPYPSTVAFPEPRRLDQDCPPEQTFCPLPADSSQLSAVMAASRGKDFVLIGPPGTGKSQTIANMIAQSLAEGRRVLFVSEKTAALDVVHRRLKEVGLGEFCLELHSSRARKGEVLAQLQRSWAAQGSIDTQRWHEESLRLQRLREQLNDHVLRLHQTHPNGLTLYRAIGITAVAEGLPVIELSWPSPQTHDRDAMVNLREVVARLEVNHSAVHAGDPARGPLAVIGRVDWSPGWQQALTQAAQQVRAVGLPLQGALQRLVQAIGLPPLPMTRLARMALGTLARVLPMARDRDWRFTVEADAAQVTAQLQDGLQLLEQHRLLSARLQSLWPDAVLAECRRAIDLLARHQSVRRQLPAAWPQPVADQLAQGLSLLTQVRDTAAQLSTRYDEQLEQINVAQLAREWTKAEQALWPLSALSKRKIRQVIEAHAIGDNTPDVAADLRTLARLRTQRADLVALDIDIPDRTVWQGLKTDPVRAAAVLQFQSALRAAAGGQPWTEAGLEMVAEGRCGEAAELALGHLRTLRTLEQEMAALHALPAAAPELWQGRRTDVARLQAVAQFQTELGALRRRGPLQNVHEAIADGAGGPAMAADLRCLQERTVLEREIEALADLAPASAGLWAGLDTPPAAVEKAGKLQSTFALAISHLADEPGEAASVRAVLDHVLGEGQAALGPSGEITVAAQHYLQALPTLQPALDELARLGELTAEARQALTDPPLAQTLGFCDTLVRSAPRLNAWCAWRKVRSEATALGLVPLVAAIEAGTVGPDQILRVFDSAYARWWLHAAVDQDEAMRAFVSAEHEKRISDFRALDDRFTTLTRDWIRACLCAELPSQDEVTRNSEWGLLKYEMTKKRNHLPLRTLMEQAPSALSRLAPCVLMSPLSIAQYLSASSATFDLVVFDEASQIPVWDAIGAIARARQVVMVGDPKQLPPTDFFNRTSEAAGEEMESILDECIGANLPCLNLSWHYRSRHESLIAFSNHRYYGGGLVTFPSPVTQDQGVSFHPVSGHYTRGGARTNVAEARALVADLVARLKSPGFRASALTIGVVTFNAEQQRLIEDLLDEERRKDAALEPFFADTELEPVFVKNLESVQGDERDIMYFSITYGPDLAGVIPMTFGPMNRNGGERRLNVAITRARQELRVFSTLLPEQIDLNRTQAQGVRDLKHFLEFAQRGASSLGQAVHGSRGGYDSPFEQAVAEALASKGWQLHTQVGVSSFRIDLAVVHPDAPGLYLTGVECDGATYHRSATARDRDKLREQVLRGLGWEIVRIWSTDWWIDRNGTLERVHQRLETLLAQSRAQRAAQAVLKAAAAPPPPPPPASGPSESVVPPVAEAAPTPEPESTALPAAPETAAETPPAVPVPKDPEAFFAPAYAATLHQLITDLVMADGPMLESVLVQRVARAHGWQRTGARIEQHVLKLAADLFDASEEPGIGRFLWPRHQPVGSVIDFREATSEAERRAIDEISLHELAGLARDVSRQVPDSEQALVVMARRLGIQRLQANKRARLQAARALACCG